MENRIEEVMSTALRSVRDLADVNTVVGRPFTLADGRTAIPVSKVTVGILTGGGEYGTAHLKKQEDYPFSGGGGAASCCAELKAAGENWLNALGTDQEAEQTEKLMAEIEMDIMPVDGLIAFAESPAGAQVFGADHAKEVAAHGKEIKAAGAKYCDCPACAAAEAILEKKDALLEK